MKAKSVCIGTNEDNPVNHALSDGWIMYGSPVITRSGCMYVCVVKLEPGEKLEDFVYESKVSRLESVG